LDCLGDAFALLQNVPIYKKLQLISTTQLRENKEAIVIGTPRINRGLRWIWIFALSLLYDCGITWMTVGEVQVQPLNGKCWAKGIKILQNT